MLQSSLLLKSQTNAENHPFDIKILLLYILALSTAARSTTSLSMFRTALRRTPVASMISENIQQVATRLVHSSQQTQQKQFVCIAVAGGGSHAISTLASTPGASSLFLEGTVVYDRNSIQSYVGQVLPDDFNYVSPDTAQGLSRAAVRHALQYRASLEDYPHCIGVGITSALVTQKLRVGRGSFGYLCATRADGTEYTCHVKLAPQYRNRTEEDIVMGQLALQAIEQLQTGAVSPLVLEEGDELNESFQSPEGEDTVFAAAERILEGHCTAVLLLPQPETKTFMAVTDPVLPLGSLVFPGSFNPPHHGHTTLAKVASRASNQKPVFLEISLFNADKPSVDAKSVSERAHRIFDLVEELPSQWGILLTNAALFKEKVEVLKPFMAPVHRGHPQFCFVIGTDTMVRILSPKYYNNSTEDMLEAVREMGRCGVHFVVGGRLEQNHNGEKSRFITGEEEVSKLPKDVQKVFTLLTEDDFRVDISSTEIRRQSSSDTSPSM